MILTKSKIIDSVKFGYITLEPFIFENVNPNSYNYRLGENLKVYQYTKNHEHVWNDIVIDNNGYTLEPGRMYLGHTLEKIGSAVYGMSLIGRSSIGRLGLFLQVSADLGHTTSNHCWTLELVAVRKVRIYPGMIIGQVSFWKNKGSVIQCKSEYLNYDKPIGRLVQI